MKKFNLLVIVAFGWVGAAFGQCTISPLTCTPDTLTGICMSPDTTQALPSAQQGVPYSTTIQVKVADSVSYFDNPGYIRIDVHYVGLDSVVGGPTGLTWSTNPTSTPSAGIVSDGCIELSGTFPDTGTYYLTFWMRRYQIEPGPTPNIADLFPRPRYMLHVGQATGIRIVSTPSVLRAYPNPTQKELSIELPNTLAEAQVSIYNGLGQIIQTQTSYNMSTVSTISVEHLPKGIYFLNIQSQEQRYQTRFVKE